MDAPDEEAEDGEDGEDVAVEDDDAAGGDPGGYAVIDGAELLEGGLVAGFQAAPVAVLKLLPVAGAVPGVPAFAHGGGGGGGDAVGPALG